MALSAILLAGAAGKAGSYRHVAVSHGTTSSTFCRYRHGETDAAMMHRRLFHKSMCTPRRLRRLYPTCCRLPGADKVGFLPISAGKRRAPPSSAVDRLISWCVSVTVVGDYCWCASVTSHHGPAKSAFCRYRQEKLVSYKTFTIHVQLPIQTGSICGDICEEVACCSN